MLIDGDTTVTVGEMAECLGCTEPRVRQLVTENIVVRASRGKYRLVDSLDNHRNWIKSGGFPSGDESPIDFNAERARKMRAEADLLERKNEIEKGDYTHMDDIGADITDAMKVISQIMLNLRLNISRIAPDMSNRVLDLIDKEQAKAMKAICELDESYNVSK